MALRFYFDHNVKHAILLGLRSRGIELVSAWEDQGERRKDPMVLRRATELERVLFTQDKDFLALAYSSLAEGEHGGVVYASQHSMVRAVIDDLELIALASEPDDLRNQLLRIPFSAHS